MFEFVKNHQPLINFSSFWEYCISVAFLLVAVFAFGIFECRAIAPAYVAGGLILCLLVWCDVNYRLLPNAAVLALFGLSVIMTTACASTNEIYFGLLGSLLGFLVAWIIRFGYFAWRGRQGLGLGDCKLFGAVGMWLGLDVLLVIWLSAVFMLLFFVGAGIRRTARKPFAPAICLATAGHIMLQENSIIWRFFLFV